MFVTNVSPTSNLPVSFDEETLPMRMRSMSPCNDAFIFNSPLLATNVFIATSEKITM